MSTPFLAHFIRWP